MKNKPIPVFPATDDKLIAYVKGELRLGQYLHRNKKVFWPRVAKRTKIGMARKAWYRAWSIHKHNPTLASILQDFIARTPRLQPREYRKALRKASRTPANAPMSRQETLAYKRGHIAACRKLGAKIEALFQDNKRLSGLVFRLNSKAGKREDGVATVPELIKEPVSVRSDRKPGILGSLIGSIGW
jgi:hypothetical protein